MEDYLSRSLRLYVYNHEYGVTRLVTITPSRSWGGTGALGCVLGFGALHRLPAPLNEPPPDPGDTLFETTGRFSNEEGRPASSSSATAGLLRSHPSGSALYHSAVTNAATAGYQGQSSDALLVPATLKSPPPSGSGPSGGATKAGIKAGRKMRKGAPGGGFDDIFKEGEEKSREEDRPSSTKAAVSLPPPPPPPGARSPQSVETESEKNG